MKPSRPTLNWMQRTLLAAFLAVAMTGLLFLVSDPGRELGAQSKRWTAADHERTNFPLLGEHRTVPCADCHLNGVLAGTPTACEACHWDRRQDDRYRTLLGLHCADCHTPFDWKKLKANSWDHGRQGGFPLSGVHATMDCDMCHPGGTFDIQAARDCYSCHQEQYRRSANHVAANYATECRQCHFSQSTWQGSLSAHTTFPLLGAHKTLACETCHVAGYNLPRDCYGCHKKDYDATINPNHRSAGYATDCQNCHLTSQTTWNQAVFNHKFPIKSGRHSGFACTDCHLTANYLVFSCIDCHSHTKSSMDDRHDDVSGYSYNSQACYTCHPNGNAGGSGIRRRR